MSAADLDEQQKGSGSNLQKSQIQADNSLHKLPPIAHEENNSMVIISMFYGIIIRLYLIDNQHHNLPHIDAKYAEFEASVGLGDGGDSCR